MISRATTFRFEEDTYKKLDELCSLARVSRPQLIKQLVNRAYDEMQGNPKLKEALSDLNKINDMLSELDYKLNG